MSRDDLDRLNAEGKAWRERNVQPVAVEQPAEPALPLPTVGEQLPLL
jgi:hypothetical protein